MRKKTNAEFLEQIKDRDLEAMEPYRGTNTKILFRCELDGHEWMAQPSPIIRGQGCPECSRRQRAEALTQKNEVLASEGGVMLVDISTPKFPEAMMLVDSEVWDRYRGGRVYAYAQDHVKYIYACCTCYNGEGRRMRPFHHLVIKPPKGMEIDHQTHGDFTYIDNTRDNLRVVTRSENHMNKSLQSNSTSGITGVVWHKSTGNWRAYIKINGKDIHLGLFQSKDLAISARKEAEKTYFGEYAYSENNI